MCLLHALSQVDYNGHLWSGSVELSKKSKEYTSFTLALTPEYSVDPSVEESNDETDDETKSVRLMMRVQEMGSWRLTLYCPYWVVNKTGLVLEYAVRCMSDQHTRKCVCDMSVSGWLYTHH